MLNLFNSFFLLLYIRVSALKQYLKHFIASEQKQNKTKKEVVYAHIRLILPAKFFLYLFSFFLIIFLFYKKKNENRWIEPY